MTESTPEPPSLQESENKFPDLSQQEDSLHPLPKASPPTVEETAIHWKLNWKTTFGILLLMGLAATLYYNLSWKPRADSAYLLSVHARISRLIDNDDLKEAESTALQIIHGNRGKAVEKEPFQVLLARIHEIRLSWRGRVKLNFVPAECKVFANGREVSRSSGTIELPMGKTLLECQAPGYKTAETSVELHKNGEIVDLSSSPIRLERLTGFLRVQSNPANIRFHLEMTRSEAGDTKEYRQETAQVTPATITCPTGEYRVVWLRPGIDKEFDQGIQVETGGLREHLKTFTTGAATLETVPVPAGIYQNGVLLGNTDASAKPNGEKHGGTLTLKLPIGKQQVIFRQAGWPDREMEFLVKADACATARQVWEHGIVSLESNPEGAAFTLDGTRIGNGPISSLPIPAGPHRIKAEVNGLETIERDLIVHNGNVTTERLLFAFSVVKIRTVGATVTLDGKHDLPGRTPMQFYVRPGLLRVTLKKAGRTVTVDPIKVLGDTDIVIDPPDL